MIKRNFLLVILYFVGLQSGWAEIPIEQITIKSQQQKSIDLPGSAHQIDGAELDVSKNYDIHKILKSIPGVYLQEEDAFGLRPNIGLRGAHPHRSKKVTLMEDGILVAPAPYSAPAAYYFPSTVSLGGVEVFKGASSTRYGPNSIGGAVNLITRDYDDQVKIQLQGDSFSGHLLDFSWSDSWRNSQWISYLSYRDSQGFKELPSGDETGFEKFSTGLKWKTHLREGFEESIEVKLNYSFEDSMETYLGLSEGDYVDNPLQRYAGSQKDEFLSNHRQYQLAYAREFEKGSFIVLRGYQHQFDRRWSKVDGFGDESIDLSEVVRFSQGRYHNEYLVLRGERDSANFSESLRLGVNDRSFVSHGLQLDGVWMIGESSTTHQLEWGVRWHEDWADRNHSYKYAEMSGGVLKDLQRDELVESGQNKDRSVSLSQYLNYKVGQPKLTLSTGMRMDAVDSEHFDKTDLSVTQRSDLLTTPGVALSSQWGKTQYFGGVHRGQNLVGPGQSSEVSPEEAINYELGLRHQASVQFEMVGFYSDYSNIVGNCSFSSGCTGDQLDKKFNGGKAEVYGLEFLLGQKWRHKAWTFPVQLSLTGTKAQFANRFESDNPEWGLGPVEEGDPLPYLPEVQGQLSLGLEFKKILSEVKINYSGSSYDQTVAEGRRVVPAYGTIDVLTEYWSSLGVRYYLKAENILDRRYLASYRPQGLRPGKPMTLMGGLQYAF